jgi:hypothetical protein
MVPDSSISAPSLEHMFYGGVHFSVDIRVHSSLQCLYIISAFF